MKACFVTLLSMMSFLLKESQTFRTICGNISFATSKPNPNAPSYKDLFAEGLLECARTCLLEAECGTLGYMDSIQMCSLLSYDGIQYEATNVLDYAGIKAYTVLGLCQSDYIFIGGKCVKISNSTKSFAKAIQSCTADGADLVQITTGRILLEIQGYMQHQGLSGHYWVGATAAAGVWKWTDGSRVPQLCPSQAAPDYSGHCLSLLVSETSCHYVNDCLVAFWFICQKPAFSTI